MGRTWQVRACIAWLTFVATASATAADNAPPQEPPHSLDPTVHITPFATAPEIVTPIGATVDAKGRLLVVESHSHFRPKDYQGPKTDRIRAFEDTTRSGRADKITTVYEGQNFLMNLVASPDGSVLVSSRNEIFRLSPDGQKSTLAHLETKSDYPHNGLHGLATDPAGNVYIGIGENLGGAWTLVGADDSKVSNATGSGAVMRCDAKGGHLVRLSRGFWNPFGLCTDPVGNVWAVDNDPDGRPPCRLIQILPGADYGFEFRYGRTGLHPLQAWDGELPGTLGMVAGVGEGPCAVRWIRGALLVTSWRDHVVQRITLTPKGASYSADVQSLITGGEDFRPVGLAEAPDGSVFVTDWVSSSYPVHHHGRIWKLTFDGTPPAFVAIPNDAQRRSQSLRESKDLPTLLKALDDHDPVIAQAAQFGLSQLPDTSKADWSSLASSRSRIGLLTALLTRANAAEIQPYVTLALNDPDDQVRQMGVRVIADLDLKDTRPQLAHLLDSDTLSPRLLAMTVATLSELDGDPAAKIDPKKIGTLLTARVTDPHASAESKTAAMHMMLATHPKIPLDQLTPLLHAPSAALQLETVRYLNDDTDPARFAPLAQIAAADKADVAVRAEAIGGLANDAEHKIDLLLMRLTHDANPTIRHEAFRSLRPAAPKLTDQQRMALEQKQQLPPEDAAQINRLLNRPPPPRPPETDLAAWQKLLDEKPGDPATGYRLFFHPAGPACFRCHMLDGRGRAIGPDLTMIGHSQTRDHVLESILQPSKDIAPLFTLWTIKTKKGDTIDGMLLRRDGQSNEVYVDSNAQEIHVKESDVIDRKMRKESLMPNGLVDGMTDQELRDLIALLTQKR